MRKSKFTESQIVAILAEDESGLAVGDVCRKQGISNATYYQWKSKYAGVSANELKRIKDLEAENSKLMRILAITAVIALRLQSASVGVSFV
jgi:putative transposase